MKEKLIDEFINSLNKSDNTKKSYRSDIEQFYIYISEIKDNKSQLPLFKSLKWSDINRYIIKLNDDNLAPTSINRKISSIKMFYDFLVKDEYIKTNPCDRVECVKDRRKKEVVYLEKDEIYKLIDAIEKYGEDLQMQKYREFIKARDKFLCLLIIKTGLRVSECSNMKNDDINFIERKIRITGKGDKERDVYIDEQIVKLYTSYFVERDKLQLINNFVFVSNNNKQLTDDSINKNLKTYCELAGIKKISCHKLRHTCATQMNTNNVDLKTISEILGHSNVATTSIYVHALEDNKKKACSIQY